MPIEIVTGAAAQQNVASLPANVMLYGGPGLAKTSDAVGAFVNGNRCNAFFIPCEDGGIKGPAHRGYPIPDHAKETVKSWGALAETISWVAQHRSNYTGVIIDGLGTLTNNLYQEATATVKTKNKYDIPMAVRTCLITLREWIRQLGLHAVYTTHGLAPAVVEGEFHRGGPLMQPKTMIQNYFGLIDTVMRVDYVQVAPMAPPTRVYFTGGMEWPAAVQVAPPDWRKWDTKNRENVTAAIVPADLGAFLRGVNPPYQL